MTFGSLAATINKEKEREYVITEKDREIVLDLKKRLPEDILPRIRKIIVFGSRATGSAGEESDLDLVVLVDEKTPDLEKQLEDIAYNVMWDHDFKPIVSLKVFAESRFENAVEKGFSFYKHVARNGISL